jgi:hypothetical protein
MTATEIRSHVRVDEEAMKILRTENRRDFNIEPAGYFNVLRPRARFIASHLQRRFAYLVRQSKGTETVEPLQILIPSARSGGAWRWVFIVLAAIGITLGFFAYLRL